MGYAFQLKVVETVCEVWEVGEVREEKEGQRKRPGYAVVPGVPVPEPEPLPVVEAPITYALAELDSVLALPVGDSIIVKEEKVETVENSVESVENSEESEEDPTGENDNTEDTTAETEEQDASEERTVDTTVIYYYEGLNEPVKRLELYCNLLTATDIGFTPVDETIMETELPAFEEASGSVHLVRSIVPLEDAETMEKSLFSLTITWENDVCSVAVGQLAGGITQPPPPPQPKPLTLGGAIDFFYSSHPSELGLDGESMLQYQVLPLDGAVLVGTTPCLRMNVHAIDENTGTNVIAGQYLVSNDGLSLYFIEPDGTLREIER